jgi:ferredoxin/tRNA A-37 threonylcarbamoyl transferase component Bud32
MKKIRLEPLGEVVALPTGRRLLDALLAKDLKVLMSCGGRGICSTCHVHICSGMEQLSPVSPNEKRTLSLVANVTPESRLACQAIVYGDGVEVRVPEGMYIESADDLLSLLGTRATQNILHPITGEILIPVGKLITRTLLEQSRRVDQDMEQLRQGFSNTNLGLESLTHSTFHASGIGMKPRFSGTTQFAWRTTVDWRSAPNTPPPASVPAEPLAPPSTQLPAPLSPAENKAPVDLQKTPRTGIVPVVPSPTASSGKPAAVPAAAPASSLSSRRVSSERLEIKPGTQLGKYLILECVGRGGSGIVYRALHMTLKMAIAIKFLQPNTKDRAAHERLAREAQLLAQLSHPNIVRVLDFEDDPVRPYVVMEFIEGLSAAELIRQCGRLQWQRALQVVLDASNGLHAAFKLNIIHRDVKPGNILVTREGTGKLVDLGLAKTVHVETGPSPSANDGEPIEGTIGYIAPETLSQSISDHRSDIYSLGATLFHLATGRLPFEGRSAAEVMLKHLRAPVPTVHELVPDAPPALSAIVQKMMAKEPQARYQDYAELISEMSSLLSTATLVNT